MALGGSVYSQTLRDITNTKLEELAKKRATFEEQRHQITESALSERDATKRLAVLTKDMKSCFSIPTFGDRIARSGTDTTRLEIDLKNLDRFLAQARYDPSVSPKILQQWQHTLFRHFEVQSLKFAYASLYGQLTTEWLANNRQQDSAKGDEDIEMEDFEHVASKKRMESRAKWEKSVFEAPKVDQGAIEKLLSGLFEATPEDSKHLVKVLKSLRAKVVEFENELARSNEINITTLGWAIRGLISSDLLNDEKRAALRDFLGNSTILGEIADVLMMRMTSLRDWTWGLEVPLEERRQLNGTFSIYTHEDLLQAIFLQHIGVRWSVFWKKTLTEFRKEVWTSPRTSISLMDRKRREYFLGSIQRAPRVESRKNSIERQGYFLSHLLDNVEQVKLGEEGDEEADFEDMVDTKPRKRTMQSARKSHGGKAPRKMLASMARRQQPPAHQACPEAEMDFSDEEEEKEMPFSTMKSMRTMTATSPATAWRPSKICFIFYRRIS